MWASCVRGRVVATGGVAGRLGGLGIFLEPEDQPNMDREHVQRGGVGDAAASANSCKMG